MKALMIVLAVSMTTPQEPLIGQIRAAIWNDLALNAMIGNGNWKASLWYNSAQDNPANPPLHIQELTCKAKRQTHLCNFVMLRDGGPAEAFGEMAPDKLHCHATFNWDQESNEW